MASKKEIDQHLQIALKEVGKIKPWFDKKVNAWVFGHSAYPVEYAGDSCEDVIKGYPLYLREFIKQRLNNNLAPFIEKKTKGHAGKHMETGKPKATKKEGKKRLYLPTDVANWFQKHPSQSISTIRRFIAKDG
jgi:hypothetical protein